MDKMDLEFKLSCYFYIFFVLFTGEVRVGSSHTVPTSLSLLDPSLVVSTANPENTLMPEQPSVPQLFRGCVGVIRIQGLLLPYFSQNDLINNTAANRFTLQVRLSSLNNILFLKIRVL